MLTLQSTCLPTLSARIVPLAPGRPVFHLNVEPASLVFYCAHAYTACDNLIHHVKMPTSEAEILKPVEAANTNSDDWEIFVLSGARIVYESNGKPASLLAAYADTPLRVDGRLETPGRSQLKYRTLRRAQAYPGAFPEEVALH
jgi:hypothetical protein